MNEKALVTDVKNLPADTSEEAYAAACWQEAKDRGYDMEKVEKALRKGPALSQEDSRRVAHSLDTLLQNIKNATPVI